MFVLQIQSTKIAASDAEGESPQENVFTNNFIALPAFACYYCHLNS